MLSGGIDKQHQAVMGQAIALSVFNPVKTRLPSYDKE